MTETQNLEKKVDTLSLADLSIQNVARHEKNPVYVKTAIDRFFSRIKEKSIVEDYVLKGYNDILNASYEACERDEESGKLVLDKYLNFYFGSMQEGLNGKLNTSKLGDFNNALKELGYDGEALNGKADISYKEALEKAKDTENRKASEEDKENKAIMDIAAGSLMQYAKIVLEKDAVANSIKSVNESLKKKEEAKKKQETKKENQEELEEAA